MKARYLSSLTASLACNQEKSPCNQRWTEGPAISEHTYAAALRTQGYLTAFNAVCAQSGSVKSEFLLLKKKMIKISSLLVSPDSLPRLFPVL